MARTPRRKAAPAKKRAKATRKKAPARKKAAKKKVAPKRATRKAPARKAPSRKTATRKGAARRAGKNVERRAGAGGAASARIGNEMMLRLEIEELHAAYSYCLDHGNLDDWPELFTEDCLYKLISRENWDLGLPLGTMFAEKRGGLLDRINAVKETSVYHERYLTHMITNTRVLGEQGGVVEASANYMVLETLPNQYTQILNAGRYLDKIVREGGRLRFKEKICIYDSVLVPASIITPI